MYRRLLGFLRPHAWRLTGNILSSVVAAVLDAFMFTLLIPFLNALFDKPALTPPGWIGELQKSVIGQFLDANDKLGSLGSVIVVIMVLVAVKNVFVWTGGLLGASLQEYVTRDLRDGVFSHMQRLPLRYFQRTKAGQIISKILADTEQTKALVTELVTKTIQNLAQIVATVIVLVKMSLTLTLISLVVAPVLTATLQPLLRRLRSGHRRLRNDYGEITSVLQEVVTGVRLVKSFRGEAYEDKRFSQASHRYSEGMIRITRVSLLSQPLTEVIGTSIAVLILWIGAREVLSGGGMDGATLITFMILVMRMLPPLKALSQTRSTAEQSFAAAERLFEVLDQPTEVEVDRGAQRIDGFRESIVFDRVGFSYETEPVLEDIDFTARKGDVVALVGPSGAGKSTLVDLIPRFYAPTRGRIVIDGIDHRQIALASLRALTGIVSQDTVLFNDTVRNNIAYGAAERFTNEQIERAARAANAHDFIAALPDGYDTVLGERGTRLSGGQRQRLALARAVAARPAVLVLDDPLSALDVDTEALVEDALREVLHATTALVVAHRPSTVMLADRVALLESGRITSVGTHSELLRESEHYRHVISSLEVEQARLREREVNL